MYLVDPDTKRENDRTWSYWGPPFEFDHLVERRWEAVLLQDLDSAAACTYSDAARTAGNTYRYLPANRFYQECRTTLGGDSRFSWIRARVEHYASHATGITATLQYPDGTVGQLQGDYLVNSVFGSTAPFRQSFVGWEVESEQDVFDPSTVTLMDFANQNRILQQQRALHFSYLLPMTPRRALVEITAVGAAQPEDALLEQLLIKEITRRVGSPAWRIVRREKGTIPLYLNRRPGPDRSDPRILNLGVAAGAARPSTGYAFRSIVETSQALAELYRTTGRLELPPARTRTSMPYTRGRQRFFDTVFMQVLQDEPEQLPAALVRLFRHNPLERVFSFLGGGSTLRQEVAIVFSLPWGPFLRALVASRRFCGGTSTSPAVGDIRRQTALDHSHREVT